jgi:hypothetical protein
LFNAISKSGIEFGSSKKRFAKVNKEQLITKLEALKSSNSDEIGRVFDEVGLGVYWANRDAFESTGVAGGDISNAVFKYLRDTQSAPINRALRKPTVNQATTLTKLNNIAEQSKKVVKGVDHDYYTIEIDGKD